MSEIRHSALLQDLIERAKRVGQRPNPPLTAERFVAAAIMASLEKEEDCQEGPLYDMCMFLWSRLQFPGPIMERILTHIDLARGTLVMDDLFMRNIMRKAMHAAEKQELQELDAVTVLETLWEELPISIKNIIDQVWLERYGNQKDDEEETEDEEESEDEEEADDSFAHLKQIMEELEKAEEEQKKEETKPMTPQQLHAIVTGKKREQLEGIVSDVKRVRSQLKESIFGQDNAINTFAEGYFQARLLSMIDRSRRRPQATFLFAGPPGVGKTFMAEQAAKALDLPFRRFDMSEYADKEANIEFCGSDKVYKNGKPGNVTSFVSENPRSVLLFDEIEKAHITAIHLFLQMLDAGRLRDNYTDEEVSFSDTILIFTTNAGKQLYEEQEGDLSSISRKVVIQALRKDTNPQTGAPYFPGAICSRFASGNVVMFNHISASDLCGIAKREILRHANSLKTVTDIQMQIDERVFTALLLSEGSAADARTIRSRAETFFNDELYELLRQLDGQNGKPGIRNLKRIRVELDMEGVSPAIQNLFECSEKPQALVFADAETVALCREKAKGLEIFGAQTPETAIALLRDKDIDFVLLDALCGAADRRQNWLNLEDVQSPARDFFRFLRSRQNVLPVYLLKQRSQKLDEEDTVSFLRQGVRGVLSVTGKGDAFGRELEQISLMLHRQASLTKLAAENKLVSFETAQRISQNGRAATIRLFDLKMAVAVDGEDAKHVLAATSRPDVGFDDIIGCQEAKQELQYFVEYLKDPKKYMGTGVKAPKGVLLYGPPGTGKTMLAKAMAGESDVTFIAAEGNQFLTKYVGEGSEKVHALFRTARKYAPAILFIDEIDAIARERKGSAQTGGNGEDTLTAFLTEMDGFVTDPSRPVFVLAATNFEVEPGRDRSLDPALMRRFDRRVYLELPGKADRIRFLRQKMAGNPALRLSDAMIENIALRGTGMSLAELDSAVELALRSAVREGSAWVTDAIMEEAFETFHGGQRKQWDASTLERVARHEAGHALLCHLGGERPAYLTIVARGDHGGYMQRAEQEGKAIFTREELLARIRTALGGRAAELVYYGRDGGVSTGASGDLASATRLAANLVCSYGMDEEFGLAVIPTGQGDAMTAQIHQAVNRILNQQLAQTVQMLSENREKLDLLVEALLLKNHMTGPEIEKVIG